MLCENPYIKGGDAYGCGRCHPCFVRRRNIWKHRIQLEALCHSKNAFVTLTYSPEKMPVDGSLVRKDATDFIKRLRKRLVTDYERLPPEILKGLIVEKGVKWRPRIRFYMVGEYGARNEGPHYHAIIFGMQTCLHGRSMFSKYRSTCCSQCDMVGEVWGNGHVFLGDVTDKSIGYTVDYITKNMRRTDDERLKGRWPEFACMSLKPGLGVDALWEVADVFMRYGLDSSESDVPRGARVGKYIQPYGRYLRRKLREMVGRDVKAPDYVDEEMQRLYEIAFNTPVGRGKKTKEVFKELLVEAGAQKVLNMKARAALHRKRNVI